MPNPLIISGIVELGKKLIDGLFPDKLAHDAERAKLELALATLAQNGELEKMSIQLSAIIAEAQSEDPWTSRARPSFMYVIYILLLFSIPMGLLSAARPDMAASITTGMTTYLSKIPQELYYLFGAGYLGYTGVRGWQKVKGKNGN